MLPAALWVKFCLILKMLSSPSCKSLEKSQNLFFFSFLFWLSQQQKRAQTQHVTNGFIMEPLQQTCQRAAAGRKSPISKRGTPGMVCVIVTRRRVETPLRTGFTLSAAQHTLAALSEFLRLRLSARREILQVFKAAKTQFTPLPHPRCFLFGVQKFLNRWRNTIYEAKSNRKWSSQRWLLSRNKGLCCIFSTHLEPATATRR